MQANQAENPMDDNNRRPDFTLPRIVARYQKADRIRSIWQLTNSFLPYFALLVGIYYVMQISIWLAVPLSVLAAGFLIRIFIICHDCGHGSFFKSQKANRFWGRVTGVITFTPFYSWTKNHRIHHETSGNLDERGIGDVTTMTVEEYLAATKMERFRYRFYRNPLAMFLLGPLQILLVQNRVKLLSSDRRDIYSVMGTNLVIAAIILTVWLTLGIEYYLLIQIPVIFIGLVFGIWLFYVQHQFEGVYWERNGNWDFIEASLAGSSFYRLPKILQFFSGSIGYHHVHHLNERVPNYKLETCHKALIEKRQVPTVGFWKSLKALNYRLWDEQNGEMISFGKFRRQYNSKVA
jgi:omega-6 fatty acid desaturase (delta-12 desaturase)